MIQSFVAPTSRVGNPRLGWRDELLTRLGLILFLGSTPLLFYLSREPGFSRALLAAVTLLPISGSVTAGFARRLRLPVRALLLVVALLLTGAVSARLAGPSPGTVLSLLLASVVAALVFGPRGALLALVAGAASFMLGASARNELATAWPANLPFVSTWVRMALSFALLTGLVSLLVATAVRRAEANARELRQAQLALQDSEQRYRLLFDGNPLPMLVYDLDSTRLLAVNAAAVEQYGWSREELLAMSVADLAVPGDPYLAEFVAGLGQPRPSVVHVELRQQRRRDGSVIDVDMTSLEVPFAGRTARLTLARNVTAERAAMAERERLQAAVERATLEWQRTFDAVEQALVVFDTELRVVRLNRPAAALVGGREPQELLGRHVATLGANEPWPTATRLLAAAAVSRATESADARSGAGGKAWTLTARLSAVGAQGEERLILVAAEITRLVELQESLRRSETMAAMGSLVAGVAHEVRNPLFGISATLDTLEREYGSQQRYARFGPVLRSQLARLKQLTQDLLDYGKPPTLRLGEAHADRLVRIAVASCDALASEHDVGVVEDVALGLPPLRVDAGRIEQVIENLLANALQHSPRGGIVRVSVGLGSEADAEAAAVCLSVEDEGPGVSEEDAAQLFEPFFSRRKGGTGLGLSIVRRIVEAHGGEVRFEKLERGARFRVLLPAGTRATRSA